MSHATAFQPFLEAIPAAAFVVDGTGCVCGRNEIGAILAGTETLQAERFAFDERITIVRRSEPLPGSVLVREALASPSGVSYGSGVTVSGVGHEPFEAEVRAVVVPDGVLVTVFDLTERRRVARDVRRIQHAEAVARAARGIAREMANATTALGAHLAERGNSRADAALRRMRRLSQQLERFAAYSDDPTEVIDTAPSPVEETVQESVNLALNGAAVRVSFAIEPDLPPTSVPSAALSQAMFNVVTNAVDATRQGGRIHIEAKHSTRAYGITVSVRDDGDGLDPTLVERIFDPYFTTKSGGVGMGLTVSRSILAHFGGDLAVHTDPGFGTTVEIELPGQSDEPEPEPAPRQRAGERTDYGGLRVIVVEDDTLVRWSLVRILSGLNCRPEAFENGERAVEAFRGAVGGDDPYRLLITDLSMPGRIDGLTLLGRIRELDPAVPAVLSSGVLHRDGSLGYHDAGFQAILRKPFGLAEMRAAVDRALEAVG